MRASHLAGCTLVVVSACFFNPHYGPGTACPTGQCPSGLTCNTQTMLCELGVPDAPGAPDAPVAADDGSASEKICLGDLIHVCIDPPASPSVLPTQLDTSSSPLCLLSNVDACVIAVSEAPIVSMVVSGRRPLILLSTRSLTVSGTIDVSSKLGKAPGPGADVGPCSSDATPPTVGEFPDGGGGWGGSFGDAGGSGGAGMSPTNAKGGFGGTAPSAIDPGNTLRGGCPGGAGAGRGGGNSGGEPGGAVLLVAATTLTIAETGSVNASGAGGGGGGGDGMAGGAGGGSGGMIMLDAATIVISGQCFANGGGGGQGGTNLPEEPGSPGGESTAPLVGGAGGTSSSVGGAGGAGGSAGNPLAAGQPGGVDPLPPQQLGGGGGGGGSVGVIKIPAFASLMSVAANVSPTPRRTSARGR